MRKIEQVANGVQVAKVYKDLDACEFLVRFFNDGTYLENADYRTSDKADAIATANAEVLRAWEDVAPLAQEIEGFPVGLLSSILDDSIDGAEWAKVTTMSIDKATGTRTAVMFTDSEDRGVSELVTLTTIAHALRTLQKQPGMLNEYILAQVMRAIADPGDSMDAEAADCVVQIAAFGQVTYG